MTNTELLASPERHEIRRVRLDLAMRRVQVARIVDLTPKMRRITFSGEDLQGFNSPSPDDHVKLMFPPPGHEDEHPVLPAMTERGVQWPAGAHPPALRDYTPRHFDPDQQQLDIDFVRHGHGPAASWAEQARPGQWLVVAGPRGSRVVPDDFDAYVIVGDDTALPAIGRWLESMPADNNVITLIDIADDSERQPLHSPAQVVKHWFARNGAAAGSSTQVIDALKVLDFPAGDVFVWVAAESRTVRAARKHLLEERGHPQAWIKASGYWKIDPEETDD